MLAREVAAYLKAIVAGAVAGLGSIVTAYGDNTLSTQEIITAVVAALVAFGAVSQVSNRPSA